MPIATARSVVITAGFAALAETLSREPALFDDAPEAAFDFAFGGGGDSSSSSSSSSSSRSSSLGSLMGGTLGAELPKHNPRPKNPPDSRNELDFTRYISVPTAIVDPSSVATSVDETEGSASPHRRGDPFHFKSDVED